MNRKANGSDRKQAWRLFERFVADLERQLQGTGALIKSPDFISDADGDEREVDCSVRGVEDGVESLTVFECRDRIGGYDIQWIDQIESKGRDIRATKVIAVHRRPLSLRAMKKAKRVGIEVRQLKRVPGLANPFGIRGFGFTQQSMKLGAARFRFSADARRQKRGEELLIRAQKQGELEGPIFFEEGRGSACTVAKYVSEVAKANQVGVGLLPGQTEKRFLVIEPKDRLFELRLCGESVPFEWAEIEFTVVCAGEMFDHQQAGLYLGPETGLDQPVDQYVMARQGRIVTGAGMTTTENRADGSIQVQHTISVSEGIGFGPALQAALDKLLSEA